MHKSFLFDANKCTGCKACEIACSIENELDADISWRQVNTFNEKHLPGISLFHLSLACNHCLDAPCMKYCPALAYSRDSDTGAVFIDQDSCIGCKYCSWVCPYDAPRFNKSTGTVEKCTFCNHRLKEGKEPACISACPTKALQVEDMPQDLSKNDIPGFSEVAIKPAIRIIPFHERQSHPAMAERPKSHSGVEPPGSTNRYIPSKINLKSEWSLVSFTFLYAILVGLITASLLANIVINAPVFLAAGFFGMALSLTHLGKKFRAGRAVLNWRNSWLSREIILVSSFMGMSALYLFLFANGKVAGGITSLTGFAALLAMDMVYVAVQRTNKVNFHSALSVLNGLHFGLLFSGIPLFFGLTSLLKLLLYGRRKFSYRKHKQATRPLLTTLRLGLGFALPLTLWMIDPADHSVFIVAGVLAGEMIDRAEFYLEIKIITPRHQMALDLAKEA